MSDTPEWIKRAAEKISELVSFIQTWTEGETNTLEVASIIKEEMEKSLVLPGATGQIKASGTDEASSELKACPASWLPVSERLPEVCKPVIGYSDRWVDEYNEMGMRECFRNDDEWQSASWNNYQDCWDVEVGAPDCWMSYPAAPTSTQVQEAVKRKKIL